MRTLGVDFAASADKTAAVELYWESGYAVVKGVHGYVGDDALIALLGASDFSAVDVPFGWPESFLALVNAHMEGTLVPPPSTDVNWRRFMTYRLTERWLMDEFKIRPLSVAADRIASAAIRWAAISARLGDQSITLFPPQVGPVVECYPAASLQSWGLPWRGYKGAAGLPLRVRILDDVERQLPMLDLGGHRSVFVDHDDAFDALIAALTACAAHLGAVHEPPPHLEVSREGWIMVPCEPLAALAR